MGWKETMQEIGGGNVSFLSEDNETTTFIVVGDPAVLEGEYKRTKSVRIGCPVITQDGYSLLIIGKRLARRLAKYEDKFETEAFTVTRHGEKSDIDTTYELKLCDDEQLKQQMFELKRTSFDPSEIAESVADAERIISQR